MAYKLVDLFAGAFSHAFMNTSKVNVVFANDVCLNSEKMYNANFKHKLTIGDINDIKRKTIPEHDILTAGFNCQPFSIAGKQLGFNDTRSNSFWKLLKIIKKKQPKICILENVKNLQSHDKGKTFKIICENLEKLNYFIKYKILNTCLITNVPQNRERIYIICFKDKDVCDKFNFDFKNVENKRISDFLVADVDKKYYYDDRFKMWDVIKNGVTKNVSENTLYQYRRYYVRENKNNVCPTLTKNAGGGGHNVPLLRDNVGVRKLTPRECFNLQGFPSTYVLPNISDSALYRLAGNAVSVPVVQLLADKIVNII